MALLSLTWFSPACNGTSEENPEKFIAPLNVEPIHVEKKFFPQPDPFPSVKDILIQGGEENWVKPIVVVGLPKSVKGGEEILLSNGTQVAQMRATAEGSFALQIEAKAGDILLLQQGGASAAELIVPVIGCPTCTTLPLVPYAIPDIPPIVRTSSDTVTIRGKADTDPGAGALAVNFSSGQVRRGELQEDQTFQMTLPAMAGDEILVFIEQIPLDIGWKLQAP